MFATDLDRDRHPLRSRLWGVVAGTILMCSVGIALVSPRTLAIGVPVLAIALVASGGARRELRVEAFVGGPATKALLAFASFALVSTAWSAAPSATVVAPINLMLVTLIGLAGVALIRREPRPNTFHMAEGLWIGLLVGLSYLLVELVTHQGLKIFFYNLLHVPKSWLRPENNFQWRGERLVAISAMDLTRSIAPVSLLVWPAMLALGRSAPRGAARLWALLILLIAAVAVAISGHETSKVALLFSVIVFALARVDHTWAKRLLQVTILGACFFVVPVALGLYRLALHEAPYIQYSLQHRIAIWNHTAEATLERPILGIGAGMMYQLSPSDFTADGKPAAGGDGFNVQAPHAHNIFLQTWYELGAVGAVLLALVCWSVLGAIERASGGFVSFGYAAYAAALVMAAASYGLWQFWFLALFALCALGYAVALRVNGAGSAPSRP